MIRHAALAILIGIALLVPTRSGMAAAADSCEEQGLALLQQYSLVSDTEPLVLPPLSGWVVDEAELLDPEREASLTTGLAALEADGGHQLVVVTLASLAGRTIEEWGLRLGNGWGIGREDHDDGVLLIVAPNERRVRIEVGCGLERAMTDAEAKRIIDDAIVPAFDNGDYPAGILAGAAAIIAEIGADE
ncbi:TPM domain-containing protein [Sphingomonas sp. CJ99]